MGYGIGAPIVNAKQMLLRDSCNKGFEGFKKALNVLKRHIYTHLSEIYLGAALKRQPDLPVTNLSRVPWHVYVVRYSFASGKDLST